MIRACILPFVLTLLLVSDVACQSGGESTPADVARLSADLQVANGSATLVADFEIWFPHEGSSVSYSVNDGPPVVAWSDSSSSESSGTISVPVALEGEGRHNLVRVTLAYRIRGHDLERSLRRHATRYDDHILLARTYRALVDKQMAYLRERAGVSDSVPLSTIARDHPELHAKLRPLYRTKIVGRTWTEHEGVRYEWVAGPEADSIFANGRLLMVGRVLSLDTIVAVAERKGIVQRSKQDSSRVPTGVDRPLKGLRFDGID